MRAEKRKRYLILAMAVVMLLCVPAVYLRVLLAAGHINGSRTAAQIAGSYGVYCDREGGELCRGNGDVPAVMGNLIGFGDVISNSLSAVYGCELGPRGFNPLTGLRSLEDKLGGALHTTLLPLSSQKVIAEELTADGVVFAYNYETGEVYTALSLPGQGYYSQDAPAGAYFNKVINGVYTPGSTMKIVALVCALQQEGLDLSAFTYDCAGYAELDDGSVIYCSYPHGSDLTIEDAIGMSCNGFITRMASCFDVEQTRQIMAQMGFYLAQEDASSRYIDAFSRSTSSGEFVTNTKFSDLWGFAGQGKTLASAVDMAMIAGAVAGNGSAATPYFARRIVNQDNGKVIYKARQPQVEELFSAQVACRAREIWEAGYKTYYSCDNGAITYMKTGTTECGDGTVNRSLVGVMEEYNTAFFICAEGVADGSEVCFSVADTLAAELEKSLSETNR